MSGVAQFAEDHAGQSQAVRAWGRGQVHGALDQLTCGPGVGLARVDERLEQEGQRLPGAFDANASYESGGFGERSSVAKIDYLAEFI
ncbi:hypothetical protein Hesp01_38430 [Herbidospora sp. NBRC 101105]|nr:hypothetical protein Hesp01_38430 [Herbidospora sp. NBRC 101105]